jgi:16S rRNA (uracil1498-N3)-methyltransferase
MRTHRVYHPDTLHLGDQITLDANATRHVVQVLRLEKNDPIVLFDGSGTDYDAELTLCRKSECQARVIGIRSREKPAKLSLHLALGISRGERMDFSLQKAVELGVNTISPIFTERTVVQLKGERLQQRLNHWQGIVRHACEQSGRSLLPALNPAQKLNSFLNGHTGMGLLLDHRATQRIHDIAKPSASITLLVGPEGGLSEAERHLANQQGFSAICLGPRVLRTETAPLAALAAMQTLWGDF